MKTKKTRADLAARAMVDGRLSRARFVERTAEDKLLFIDSNRHCDAKQIGCPLPSRTMNHLRKVGGDPFCSLGMAEIAANLSALIVLSEYAGSQHRLVIPLVGPRVRGYLHELQSASSDLELLLIDRHGWLRAVCPIEMPESYLDNAIALHREEGATGPEDLQSQILCAGADLLNREAIPARTGKYNNEEVFVSILEPNELFAGQCTILEISEKLMASQP